MLQILERQGTIQIIHIRRNLVYKEEVQYAFKNECKRSIQIDVLNVKASTWETDRCLLHFKTVQNGYD